MGEDRSATGRKRVYHLLDGIRGTAALIIVHHHTAWLFHSEPLWGAYLAVDLFFVLSGFVIAHSYEDKLRAGWGWRRFMVARLIRLYPLYLLGLALGGVALAGRMLQSPDGMGGLALYSQACFSALFMLPNWDVPALVGARWSLTYELLSNAVYAAIVSWLTDARLLLVIAFSGLALIALATHGVKIDSGWQYYQAPMALARVGYSFFIGLLLYRLHAGRALPRTAIATIAVAAALWGGAMLFTRGSGPMAELALILMGFPALTLLAASFDVGRLGAQLCGFLGTISYAVYVLHQPASLLFDAVVQRLAARGVPLGSYGGWIFLAGLIVAARILDAIYDRPVRRSLLAWASRDRRVRAVC